MQGEGASVGMLYDEKGEHAIARLSYRLERRVALLEAQLNPPEPDPLEVGTAVFRQMNKAKKSLQRRS